MVYTQDFGKPRIGAEMGEVPPQPQGEDVAFEEELMEQWRTGRLAQEILDRAQVPAYDEWQRQTQFQGLPPELQPPPIQQYAPKEVKSGLTANELTPKTREILRKIGYQIPDEEPFIRLAKPGEVGAFGEQALVSVRPRSVMHKTWVAGWGDVLATAGAGAKWLGQEGMAKTLAEGGQRLQDIAPEDDLGPFQPGLLADPRFWTHRVVRTLPFTISLIPAAIIGAYGGGLAAGALGLGAFGTAVLGSVGAAGLSRPIESFFEAGGAYDQAIRMGMTPEEADDAAEEVFYKNLTLAGMDAAEFITAFAPGGAAARTGRNILLRTARGAGGRLILTGLTEAGEEGIQEVFQRQALGLPVDLDPEMQQAMAIGGIFGFGLGGGGQVFTSLRGRLKDQMTGAQRAEFERVKQQLIDTGSVMTDTGVWTPDTYGVPEGETGRFNQEGAELAALDYFTERNEEVVRTTLDAVIREEWEKQMAPGRVTPETYAMAAEYVGEEAARGEELRRLDEEISQINKALSTPAEMERRSPQRLAEMHMTRDRLIARKAELQRPAAQAAFGFQPESGAIVDREAYTIMPKEKAMEQTRMAMGEMGVPTPMEEEIARRQAEAVAAEVAPEVVPPAEGPQAEGEAIAEELGVDYAGPQMDNGKFLFHLLTDPETGSTFAGMTLEEARTKLAETRAKFAAAAAVPVAEAPEAAAPSLAPTRTDVPVEGGTITKAFGADLKDVYEFQFNLVELDELITSHTETFEWNPKFPRELQQRIRERAASRDQVNRIAWSLEPDGLLHDTQMLDSGPPIIGPDNVVESGNARVMALRVAPQDRRAAYRARLLAYADRYGLTREQMDAMKFPVLVRTRISEVDRVEFAAAANVPVAMALSTFEQGLADARRLTPATVASLDIAEGESIESALTKKKNQRLVGAFVESLPKTERAGVADATGRLSQAGVTRLKVALLVQTYNGADGQILAQVFVESTEPGIKQIESAVLRTLGEMAQAEAEIAAGNSPPELSVTDDLARVIRVYADVKRPDSAFKSISDYLAQTGFDRPLNELQLKILGHLEDIASKPRLLRDFFADLAKRVSAAPSPGQVDMFPEMEALTKETLVDQAIAEHREEVKLTPLEQAKVIAPQAEAAPELTHQEQLQLDIVENIIHAHEVNERRLRGLRRRFEQDPDYTVLVPREFAEEEGARQPVRDLIEYFDGVTLYLETEMRKQVKTLDKMRKKGRERRAAEPRVTAAEKKMARAPTPPVEPQWMRREREVGAFMREPMPVTEPLAGPPPPTPATVGTLVHNLKMRRESLVQEIATAKGRPKERLQEDLEHLDRTVKDLEADMPRPSIGPVPPAKGPPGAMPPRRRPPIPGQPQLGAEPPRPGQPLVMDLPEIDDLITANYVPNRMAALGALISRVPWLGKFVASFNPMLKAITWPERAVIAWTGMLDMAPSIATTTMYYVRQNAPAFRFKMVGAREADIVTNVVPLDPTASLSIWDILSYPDRYYLNDAQRVEADLMHTMLEEQRAQELAAGVKEPELVGDLGFRYFPRFVKALRDISGEIVTEIQTGVRRRPAARQSFQLHRMYETAKDGILAGKDYGTDYRGAVEMRLTAGQKAIADRKLIGYMKLPHIGGRLAAIAIETEAEKAGYPARWTKHREPIIGKEGTIWLAGLNNMIYPIETAQIVNEMIRGEIKSSQLLGTLNKANAVARMGQTAIDLGYGLIQLQLSITSDPVTWGRAMTMAIETLMDPKAYSRWAKEHKWSQDRMIRGGAAPFTGTEFTEAIRPGGWLGKVPIIGGLFTRFGISFDAAIDTSRTLLYEGLYDRIATPQDETAIINMVDNMVGIASSRRLGVTQIHRQSETFALYAPRYFRSMVSFVIDVFSGGIRTEVAAKALAKFAVGSAMFMAALAMALGQEDRLKPTKEEPLPIMFDPRSGQFMTVEIGGSHIGLGGAYVALMRLLGSITKAAQDDPKSFFKVDPHENPLLRYGYGRSSPISGAVVDIATGRTYLRERLETPLDYGKLFIDKTFPFWLAGALTDVPRAGLGKAAAEWWGLRAWMVQYWEQAEKFADDHIKNIPEHMILDYQHEAWLNGELAYDDLNNGQRAWLLREYDQYETLREQARKQRMERGTDFEVAEEEAREMLNATFQADMEVIAEGYLNRQIGFWDYWEQRQYLKRIRSGQYQMLETMRLLLDAEAQEGLEKWLLEHEKAEDKAVDDYFEITTNPLVVGGVPDWDATYAEAERYLQTLAPDVREYVERHKDDWINNLGPNAEEVERTLLEQPLPGGRGYGPGGWGPGGLGPGGW